MSAIGPDLPPHLLAKLKRKQEEAVEDAGTKSSGAKRSPSPSEGEKRRRVMGPVMPPAPLDERPPEPPNRQEDDDSEDDDGFGPSLPPTGAEAQNNDNELHDSSKWPDTAPREQKPKRDEWMTMPPKQDDLAARMDPTKIRARGFNTGKAARAADVGGDDSSAWNETPEQKQKRLADEMMGVSKSSNAGPQRPPKGSDMDGDTATAKQIKEKTEKIRGPSLLERHTKTVGPEAEDDPSKRAFDREKDMGSGVRIGNVQRQEMLNKASDYSSKFSGGSYL